MLLLILQETTAHLYRIRKVQDRMSQSCFGSTRQTNILTQYLADGFNVMADWCKLYLISNKY